MKSRNHSGNSFIRRLGIALAVAFGLGGFGGAVAPVVQAQAATGVAVAQQPLTVQPSIPPDIMLMVDDSGSMAWSIMPDLNDLSDSSLSGERSSAVNGVYYNPGTAYATPPKADSTATAPDFFPNNAAAAWPNAWYAPMAGSATTQDVTKASGYVGNSSVGTTGKFPFYDSFYKQCDVNGNCGNYQLDTTGYCQTNGGCITAFAYTTGSAGSGYTTHYISGNCASIPAGAGSTCTSATDTSGAAAPAGVPAGQNAMNWYSYYSSRIKMARSGLMMAFAGLDGDFRVGFGSINGTAARWMTSNVSNTYAFSTPTNGSNLMAEVQPFGNGSAGTQKASFWQWVGQLSPTANTPLRQALNAVGQYYSGSDSSTPASNAWDTMSSDPGYVAGGSNPPIACRQAYTILTTDGFWNTSYSGVGNADGTGGNAITGPNGQSYTYTPTQPFADTWPNTLADVAMHYWQTDLQPGIANEVPPGASDPAFWQHMVTFTLGLGYAPSGVTGTAPDGDSPPSVQDIFNWSNDGGGAGDKYAINGFGWPQPADNSPNNIADLEHAGVNGHGGFFSAGNPQAFVSGIETALKRATERVGTGASLAANSTQLTTGTVIYQANYYTSTWKGDLKAYSVNAANGAIAGTPTWQASSMMPAAGARDIVTWNGSAFVPFQNGGGAPPGLSAAQATALGGGATGNPASEEALVNWLRGDTSQEQQNGGGFRTRDWVLGDIVDSQPVYSGAPNPNEFINQTFAGTTVDTTTNTVPFYTWAVGSTDSSGTFTPSAASQRTPLIFVAANDGMLHAFNAQTGAETFAYLPGAVITAGLANLANPAYGSAADPHQFYNDGQVTVADAWLPALPQVNGSSWHTILVGTTGRGSAEAVYALDVTDPGNIRPLWERAAGDGLPGSQYIGQMIGKPVIAQTSYTAATSSTGAASTWSVLIGNGYNSASGGAALLQFDLGTGALSVHTTSDTTTGNGLAAPVAWMDNAGDGVSDVAYAGDLHGHVWSFRLNDTTGANPSPTSTGTLLFTAKDANGKVQPITAGMLAGQDPAAGNVWLFFGTGQYLSNSDLANRDTQTWYGLIVQSATRNLVSNLANGRSALVQRSITAQTTGGGGSLPARTISTQTINSSNGTTDMAGKSGWYVDLLAPINGAAVQQGERMVDPNEFQGSLLIAVSRIPLVTDVCNPSGSGWIMALDPFTGSAPSSDFFDVNGDGYINGGDEVNGQHTAGVGFGSLPNAPIFVGGIMETSFDNGSTASLKTAGTVGTSQRVTWRELVNP